MRVEPELAAARRAEPELRDVDLAGAAVEAEIEPDPERAIVLVADVEPADGGGDLELRERLREIGGDGRAVAAHHDPVDPLAGRHRRQRVPRPRERDVQVYSGLAGRAVDAGERAAPRELAAPGVGPREIEVDVVGVVLRGGDAVDDHPLERQHVVVQNAQLAAPFGDHRAAVEPEDRVRGIDRRLDERHRAVHVLELEPPGAREIEDGVEVTQLGVGDLELRSRARGRAWRGGRRRGLGAERRQEPDRVAVFELSEAPERLGDAQLVNREAAADQRPQPDLRFEIRDVEHHRPLRVDDLEPLDGDRAGGVGGEIDQRAQVPGDAADRHLARVRRERPLDQVAEPRPLQHHRRRQHGEGDEPERPDSDAAGHAGDASETRGRSWATRQGGTIVS